VKCDVAQPPPLPATDSGLKLTILQRNVGQKWVGCMLTAAGTQLPHIDLEYHLQQASKSFYATRWILLDRSVSILETVKIFQCQCRGFICRMFWQRAQGNLQLPAGYFGCSISKNYADQSLDHSQNLIGMRLGTRFFIYGMNGSETFFHMHTPRYLLSFEGVPNVYLTTRNRNGMKVVKFDTCFEKPVLHALRKTAEMSFVLDRKLFEVRTLRPLVFVSNFICLHRQ